METDPVFVAVAEMISKALSVSIEKVTPTASFINDLEADSLDLVELEMSLEDKYGIRFPQEEPRKLNTVQDLVDLVKDLIKKKTQA